MLVIGDLTNIIMIVSKFLTKIIFCNETDSTLFQIFSLKFNYSNLSIRYKRYKILLKNKLINFHTYRCMNIYGVYILKKKF